MRRLDAYKRQEARPAAGADLLVALYDRALARLGSLRYLAEDGAPTGLALLEAQTLVYAIAAGVDREGDPNAARLLQLFDYALWKLGRGAPADVDAVISVLTTLRLGYVDARDAAAASAAG